MSTALMVLFGFFVISALLRLPIVLTMFGSSVAYLWASKQDIGIIVDQTMNSMVGLYVLLAVPMFILAANVMNAATISDRLWNAADAVVGRFKGGHGHVTVLMNVLVSSMSGSAASDAAGAGMVAIRQMRQAGYPGGLACAIAAAASTLGPIIPPSIPMVLYGLISGASIGALFLAGIVPGLFMAVSLMVLIFLIADKRKLPMSEKVPFRALPRVFGQAALPMTLPALLLGGMWTGVFTPTEAAAVAAGWAVIIGVFVYRNVNFKTLVAVFADSARQSTVVMMLLISSFMVNYAITAEGLAEGLARYIDHLDLSPIGFMILVNILFLILGTVLDGAVMLLVFVPVLLPSVNALGIDLTYFGVIVIINFMIAVISPPYGLILFVLSALAKVPIREINREVWQFCLPLTIVMFILIAFPEITLFLPRSLGLLK
jgi:tripartite ATP-independent transporter DctM subunit